MGYPIGIVGQWGPVDSKHYRLFPVLLVTLQNLYDLCARAIAHREIKLVFPQKFYAYWLDFLVLGSFRHDTKGEK